MAHTKSAKKLIRIMEERRLRNRSIHRAVKTQIGKAENMIIAGEREPAAQAVREATTALDKAAQKGVLHPNKSARRKSRLMKKLNAAFPPSA